MIVNPLSAGGATGRRWELIRAAISAHFREFKYVFTEGPRQATLIARELLRDGADLLIGVGGDGTLSEIGNGFYHEEQGALINPEANLGVIPSGTGSDFARSLRIPRDLRGSIEIIKSRAIKKIDIGRVSFQGEGGNLETRYFMNVGDFGLGADVIRRLARIPQKRRGPLTYYGGLLAALCSMRSYEVEIECDPAERIKGRFVIGALANGSIFGCGMQIAPGALLDDGFFDLVLVEEIGAWEVLRNTPRLYRGTIAKHPRVSVRRVRRALINSSGDACLELDGEAVGRLPASFQIIPAALRLRCGQQP